VSWLAYQYARRTVIFYRTMPAKVPTNATTKKKFFDLPTNATTKKKFLTYLDLQEALRATLVDYWPVTAKNKSSKRKVFFFAQLRFS
jgi:hypothetical protein